MSDIRRPDGIEHRHIHEDGGTRLHRWPIGVAGLGIVLAASFFGVYGRESRLTAAGDAAVLTVHAPVRIRDGQLYEMTFTVEARRPIADLVLLVDADAWRDVTVNTFVPAAETETSRDGAFAFGFGPLPAGQTLTVKVDGQVNPTHWPPLNRGPISIADGERILATVDYKLEVLP